MTIHEFQGDYRFLSNFYPSPITVAGVGTFATGEHLYQALKTLDLRAVWDIVATQSPGEAKRMGSVIPLRPDWDEVKDRAMEITVARKFYSNPDLMQKLWETDGDLIEGNHWHDNYWGACHCDTKRCETVEKKNKLGNILMAFRDESYHWAAMDI